MKQHKRYDYRLFDVALVHQVTRWIDRTKYPDAYLAADSADEVSAIREALASGYRWLRSEGAWAIFERVSCVSGATDDAPAEYAASADPARPQPQTE